MRRLFGNLRVSHRNMSNRELVQSIAKRMMYDPRTVKKYCVAGVAPKAQGRKVSIVDLTRKKNIVVLAVIESALLRRPTMYLSELQHIVRWGISET